MTDDQQLDDIYDRIQTCDETELVRHLSDSVVRLVRAMQVLQARVERLEAASVPYGGYTYG